MVYGPPEESDERQAQVTTLVNNLRNTEGDIETGPCGEHCIDPITPNPLNPEINLYILLTVLHVSYCSV